MTPDPNPFPHMEMIPMVKIKMFLLSVIVWLKGEPVVTRVLAALAVTALAKQGISLSADQTLAMSIIAGAIAAHSARRKVTPSHKIPVKAARARKPATSR